MKKIVLINLLLLLISTTAFTQIVEVPLVDRLHNASMVFEGRILQKKSFWDAGHRHIYTTNLVQVGKMFKGKRPRGYVEIITEGGAVDTMMEQVSPALSLEAADMGVFLCTPSGVSFPAPIRWNGLMKLSCYADQQGFIKYDLLTHTASDPFHTYGNVHKDFHHLLRNLIKGWDKNKADEEESSLLPAGPGAPVPMAAAVTTFTPSVVTAGTHTVLTIRGTGFGATQGSGRVLFSNADNGGQTIDVAPLPSQYLTWTDTLIRVEVPSGAGTGPFRVVPATGTTYTSPALTVRYNITNVSYNGSAYVARLVNRNGSGGYTWQMSTTFYNNTGARGAFTRAMETWRCGTFVNFNLGPVTTNNTAARDGIIVVRFDQGSELPAGVLGRCVSYYSGCYSGSTITWYVNEFDITFDDATNWNYSTATPAFSQYDFQSVAVHELGHGHQLGHVINTADVMHFALANGQTRRTLNTDDIDGGRYVMNLSTGAGACGYGPMAALNASNCALPVPVARISEDYTDISSSFASASWLMPNPFENEACLKIQTEGSYPLRIIITDIQGKILLDASGLHTNEEFRFGSSLPYGIYILQAEYGSEKVTARIVKK